MIKARRDEGRTSYELSRRALLVTVGLVGDEPLENGQHKVERAVFEDLEERLDPARDARRVSRRARTQEQGCQRTW